jgi:hypothetical protein
MAIGEQHLLPAVRQSDPDTLLISNGFSCETQILQGTGRKPLHIAEVIRMGLKPRQDGEPAEVRGRRPSAALEGAFVAGAALLAGGLLYWALSGRRSHRPAARRPRTDGWRATAPDLAAIRPAGV